MIPAATARTPTGTNQESPVTLEPSSTPQLFPLDQPRVQVAPSREASDTWDLTLIEDGLRIGEVAKVGDMFAAAARVHDASFYTCLPVQIGSDRQTRTSSFTEAIEAVLHEWDTPKPPFMAALRVAGQSKPAVSVGRPGEERYGMALTQHGLGEAGRMSTRRTRGLREAGSVEGHSA